MFFCSLDSRITACSEPEIRQVALAETGVASVEIPLLSGMMQLEFTPGTYPARITSEKANCTLKIIVIGMYSMIIWPFRKTHYSFSKL